MSILTARKRRHRRIRKKIFGTKEKPRFFVFKSNKHIYASLINDIDGKTIFSVSTLSKKLNVKSSSEIGELVAKKAKSMGIEKVVFDRGGYIYHGKIAALAESARKGGLKF